MSRLRIVGALAIFSLISLALPNWSSMFDVRALIIDPDVSTPSAPLGGSFAPLSSSQEDNGISAQVGSGETCEADDDTGCITVTKELTDPQNLVPDSEERTLEFLIRVNGGQGQETNFRLNSGESRSIDVTAGNTYTVEEVSHTNGIQVETTKIGDCEAVRIQAGDNLQCTISNRITGVTGDNLADH